MAHCLAWLMWVLVVGWTPQTAHASEGETDTRALAVFPVQGKLGIHAHLAELVSERVLLDVRQRAAFGRIMSPAEIAQLMPANEQKTLLECASDECSLVDNELAGALGATHITVGNVTRLQKSFQLTLKVFDLRKGLVIATVTHRIPGESPEALLDGVRPAVVELLVNAGMNRLPTAALFPIGARLGTPSTTTDRFTVSLLTQLRRYPAFDLVFGPADIATRMTPTQQGVVTACASDECAVVDEDLLGGLGVTHVVLGNVALAGQVLLVSLKLIHIKSGVVVAALSEKVPNAAALDAYAQSAAQRLLVDGKMLTQAAALEATAPPPEASARSGKPMWMVAAGAGALGAVLLVAFVVSGALTGVAAALWLVPDLQYLRRPITESLGPQAKSVVVQAPVGVLGTLTVLSLVLGAGSLLVSGVSALAALTLGMGEP
jgi:TolB-like protein